MIFIFAIGYEEFLFGYVDGNEFLIKNDIKQIVAFIMSNEYNEVIIEDSSENLVLTTVFGGYIFKCPDQEFLVNKLLPVLVPVQRREVKSPKYAPYVLKNPRLIK
jgi:hypothetical protein